MNVCVSLTKGTHRVRKLGWAMAVDNSAATSAASLPEAEMNNLSIAEPFDSSHDTLDFAPSAEETTPLRVARARARPKNFSAESPSHNITPFDASRSTSLLASNLSSNRNNDSSQNEDIDDEDLPKKGTKGESGKSSPFYWEPDHSGSRSFRGRASTDLREAAFDSPLSSLRQSSGENGLYSNGSATPEFPSEIDESHSKGNKSTLPDQERSSQGSPRELAQGRPSEPQPFHEDLEQMESSPQQTSPIFASSGSHAPSEKFSRGFEDIDEIMSPRGLLSFDMCAPSSTRKLEERVKHLESDKLDLQLKLQEYRDRTSSDGELERVLSQLRRAETRIVDLENAMDRKNEVIRHLSAQTEEYSALRRRADEAEKVARESQEYAEVFQDELNHAEETRNEREQQFFSAMRNIEGKLPEVFHKACDCKSADEGLNYLIEGLKVLSQQISGLEAQKEELEGNFERIRKMLDARDASGALAGVVNILEEKASLEEALETQIRRNKETATNHNQVVHALREQLSAVSRQPEDTQILHKELEEMREELERQHQQGASASKHFYYLVSTALSTLNESLGPEFRRSSDSELQAIITEARATNTSKIPRLTQLLLGYISDLCVDARRAELFSELQTRVRELESLLAVRLDRLGADRVLRAQFDDLQATLKLEREKRKSEYEEAQATIARLAAM